MKNTKYNKVSYDAMKGSHKLDSFINKEVESSVEQQPIVEQFADEEEYMKFIKDKQLNEEIIKVEKEISNIVGSNEKDKSKSD
jgi:hypothetical protein